MRLQPGDLIGGKYRIVRLIGDGGMGAVYEARHEVLGSAVALKFLHAELTKRPGLATRFLQEARVSASIQSPHVTRVTDVDTTVDGSPFLVMELLIGETLQQVLDRERKLPLDHAVDYALQTLSGLEAAHALGVVHRDLKPDNIFITRSTGGPILKLLDFGIAKLRQSNEYTKGLTRPGAVMGTPEYMAPEQLYAADRVDHRADLYSLGAILYEMLSGERPAYGDDAQQIIAQVLEGNVKRITEYVADLPEGLPDIVHRALAPDKNRRFESAMQMRIALAAFAGELSHAGRLAATPVPAAHIPSPDPPATDATVDVAPHSGAVPATLPPEDEQGTRLEPVVQKGGTQEAPKQLMQQIASATHAPPGGHAGGYSMPPAPGTPYYTHGPSYVGYGPPRPRKRALGAIVALLLGVLMTGAVIALIVVNREQNDEPVEALPTTEPAPPTTIAAQQDQPQAGEPFTPPPAALPEQPPRTTPTRPSTRPRDAGADAGGARVDAGPFGPFPPFTLPSTLPPLPPGIPTTLPPGFPQIPGLSPPPAEPAPGN